MFFHASGEGGSSSGKGNGGLMSFIFGGQNDDKPRQVTSPVKLPQVPDTVRQSVEPTDREKIELQIIKVSFLEFSRKLLRFFFTAVAFFLYKIIYSHAHFCCFVHARILSRATLTLYVKTSKT